MNRHPHASPAQPLALMAPSVEFPVTICVVCYGEHFVLARRFLTSLYQCTPPTLFTLRAGLNEVEAATLGLFEEYADRFGNVNLFVEPRNIFKNPLMRRMFCEAPLQTRWTVWCDDDTHFTRPDWLQRLGLKIECSPEVAAWGKLYSLCRRDALTLDWIRAARWYRGLPFKPGQDPKGGDAVEFRFLTGGFWAMRTDALRFLDWPDPRLVQASEDFVLGEALRQNGYTLGRFNAGVMVNDAPRRNADAPQISQLAL